MVATRTKSISGSFPVTVGAMNKSIPQWGPLLQKWRSTVSHKVWRGTGDCSWWYGERASVSQLAGAAWKLKEGWAIQEYAGIRGDDGRGRIDLAVEAARGLCSAVEAKQIWPRLGAAYVTEWIEHALGDATGQLTQEKDSWIRDHERYDHVAVVFVVPKGDPTNRDPANAINTLTKTIASCCAKSPAPTISAWTFPSWARRLEYGGHTYPGIGLVARLVHPRVVAG